jgi:hypothetical protein
MVNLIYVNLLLLKFYNGVVNNGRIGDSRGDTFRQIQLLLCNGTINYTA